MVRTADTALRVVGGKSTRKTGNAAIRDTFVSPTNSSSDKGTGGLNSVCPRETPAWQKPITNFFTVVDKSHENKSNKAGSSKAAPESNDVNMVEGTIEHQQSNVEAMDEECEERAKETDKDTENKENNVLNGNANDTEMKEDDTKKTKTRDDDDDDFELVARRKKIKLDPAICSRLHEFEQ